MADGSGILWSYLAVVNQLFPIKVFKGVAVRTSIEERMVVPHFPFISASSDGNKRRQKCKLLLDM